MNVKEDLFLERYNKLNDRQRDAVDTIYGAVMVIAGPGTGKTEVLAMRIANLLRSEAQVQPHEILCLTYTDEAANSMRRRLIQIAGTAAHKVNIYTFHGFCNAIIQNNSDYFSKREMQPVSDLEKADLMYNMLESLPPGHLFRKLSGDIYSDSSRLKDFFETMKKEFLTPEAISTAIDEYIASLPERPEYIYQRNGKGYKKGDLKQAKIDEQVKKMETTRAAALLFDEYQKRMKAIHRYDFQDMILWVIDAFKKHPELLQSYQERYQFILADEFQDTNGSQNQILTYLTSYWENPNIFVVGDDDQSIFEFQGARIRNITDFYELHKNDIKIVVLPQNYRSSQAVIDWAMATIKNNNQRLINHLQNLNLNKDIVAANDRFKDGKDTVAPVVRVYPNILQEEADIVLRIEQLKKEGVPLQEIGVLYTQHKQASNIIELLERKEIPYNVKKQVNVLTLPIVEQILNVLRYLEAERKKPFEGETHLFELMHASYFGIEPNDIALLALYMQTKRKETGPIRWRLALSNPLMIEALNLKSAKALHRLGKNLDEWEKHLSSLPLPLLVEKIIHEGGIVAKLLQETDHVWNMQALNSFFDFVKESAFGNVGIKVSEFLLTIDRMNKEKISVNLQRVVQSDNGVYLFTAHSAKGNEFEHVFLIGCTKNFWENKRGSGGSIMLPDTITATEIDTENSYKEEVARRLFYVALTRAKKHLQISYAVNDNNGKGQEPSVFIDEISQPEERLSGAVSPEQIVDHLSWAMKPVPEVRIKIANAEWITRNLQQLTMSVTQLTKYLRCPLAFYYETVLRVPFQKNDALGFGSAVHNTIERMYKEMKANDDVFPPIEEVLAIFKKELYRESGCFNTIQFERRMEQGIQELTDYYNHYIETFHKNVAIEFKVPRFYLEGVPVTGKIDKIEMFKDSCIVVDYKTGNPDKSAKANLAQPNEKAPNGGDYWRQMVFYKLLLENSDERHWKVEKGYFDYIQKDKNGDFKRLFVPIFPEDETTVRNQLKESYNRIMNHDFDKGCGEEKCHWCNFAKRYELVASGEETEIDDE